MSPSSLSSPSFELRELDLDASFHGDIPLDRAGYERMYLLAGCRLWMAELDGSDGREGREGEQGGPTELRASFASGR